MIFFNTNLDDKEIEEKLKELDEDHQREIQTRYGRGKIKNYQLSSSSTNNDGNGKTLQHHNKKRPYNNSNKTNPKEESPKEESSVKEIFSQKYADNDYLAEAILIGNKPYFAVSIKRGLHSNSENITDTADDDNEDISCNNNNDNNYFPSIVLQESIPLDETTILKPLASISSCLFLTILLFFSVLMIYYYFISTISYINP
jgi:hypothetical protein